MGDHRGDLKGWGTDWVGAPLRAQHVDSGPGFRSPPSSFRPADEPPALPLTPCVTCLTGGWPGILTIPTRSRRMWEGGGRCSVRKHGCEQGQEHEDSGVKLLWE